MVVWKCSDKINTSLEREEKRRETLMIEYTKCLEKMHDEMLRLHKTINHNEFLAKFQQTQLAAGDINIFHASIYELAQAVVSSLNQIWSNWQKKPIEINNNEVMDPANAETYNRICEMEKELQQYQEEIDEIRRKKITKLQTVQKSTDKENSLIKDDYFQLLPTSFQVCCVCSAVNLPFQNIEVFVEKANNEMQFLLKNLESALPIRKTFGISKRPGFFVILFIFMSYIKKKNEIEKGLSVEEWINFVEQTIVTLKNSNVCEFLQLTAEDIKK
ncbi:hypothetical protein RFI_17759 [Reticulomyxa filosa]|uniref:Uncharacterized protein n=1 Tax=Reticulomyxa filosa TaxID=46433 RepID=X6N2D6_RETFI|nr:hypothetical protein RFI_17759 [Reticulomyxa filosa]|eukprot:ETO19472.1 hypothetical protein RFI_17759 [Reticulomyxa filosa]